MRRFSNSVISRYRCRCRCRRTFCLRVARLCPPIGAASNSVPLASLLRNEERPNQLNEPRNLCDPSFLHRGVEYCMYLPSKRPSSVPWDTTREDKVHSKQDVGQHSRYTMAQVRCNTDMKNEIVHSFALLHPLHISPLHLECHRHIESCLK